MISRWGRSLHSTSTESRSKADLARGVVSIRDFSVVASGVQFCTCGCVRDEWCAVLHLWVWVPTSMFLQSRAARLSLLREASWEGENRREGVEVSYQNLDRIYLLFQTISQALSCNIPVTLPEDGELVAQ